MPILAVDKNGNFYQTSRDRSDGHGYSASPRAVSQRDNMLGAPNLKMQDRNRRSILANKAQLAGEAQDKKIALDAYKRQQRVAMQRAQISQAMREDPAYQADMLKKALASGSGNGVAGFDNKKRTQGDPLSANGVSGFYGMDERQRAIQAAISGVGVMPESATRISKSEARQLAMGAQFEAGLRRQAQMQQVQEAQRKQKVRAQKIRQQQAIGAWVAGITDPNASRPIGRRR